jgi:hypothetical protein
LIANLASQDLVNGEGFALLDPHGDLVEQVLNAVPQERQGDLVYFNVPDTSRPLAFNPLEATEARLRPLAGVHPAKRVAGTSGCAGHDTARCA